MKRSTQYLLQEKENRAAIMIINSKTDAILIAKLSDEDTVFSEILHENLKFFAASMYFDLEEQTENNFTKMDVLLRFVKGGGILIAADSNSPGTMLKQTREVESWRST